MKLNVKNLKLKDELGNFLALIKQQLEEVTALALTEKGRVNPTILKAMVDLTKCFEAATRSKIAIDKAEKKREDSLSPDEELEEVKLYLLEFEHRQRLEIVNDIILRHNKKCMSAKKPFLVREVGDGIAN
jgi:hypothetical protein